MECQRQKPVPHDPDPGMTKSVRTDLEGLGYSK